MRQTMMRGLFHGLSVAAVMMIGVALTPPAVAADEEPLICSIIEARECTPDSPCRKVKLTDIFLAPLVVLDFAKNIIVSAAMDDRGRTEKITGHVKTPDEHIIYGHSDHKAWNAVVSRKSGSMTANVNSGDTNHVLFGNCAPHAYP